MNKYNELKSYRDYHNLIDGLIELNLNRRELFNKQPYTNMGLIEIAMSFCTIECNIGRQSGKTTYIKSKINNDTLIIVPNHNYKKHYLSCGMNNNIKTIHSFISKSAWPNRFYKTIFFEDLSFTKHNANFYEVYEALVYHYPFQQTFIFLG